MGEGGGRAQTGGTWGKMDRPIMPFTTPELPSRTVLMVSRPEATKKKTTQNQRNRVERLGSFKEEKNLRAGSPSVE